MENSARRRSSRITAKNEKIKEKESAKPAEKRNKGKVKENTDLDEDLKFLIEFESESDDDKNDEPYAPTRRRKRTDNHKTPKKVMSSTKRKRNGGSSSTSRANVLSPGIVPESNDNQNVSDLPQRDNPNEPHAEPDNPELEASYAILEQLTKMVPSSDKRPAASPSGEGGQNTTTAEHAISSPEFVGENIGTHSSALVEENTTQEQPAAAAKTTEARNRHQSFRELLNGESSTPCLASDAHDQINDKGKEVHQTLPTIIILDEESQNAEHDCADDAPVAAAKNGEIDHKGKRIMHQINPPKLLADAMKRSIINPYIPSSSRPSSFLHLEGASFSSWSNPNNSLSGLDLNLAPYGNANMSPNVNQQQPQHSNALLSFSYSDLQRGVGMLNPMGPFPKQQPNLLLSAELLVPSGMDGRGMRNLDLNQLPPQDEEQEDAQNDKVDNHHLID